MDPQNTNNLDPKLQETYNRVMGTTTQPGIQPAAAMPAAPGAAPIPTPMAPPTQPLAAPGPTLSFQAAAPTPVAAPGTPVGVVAPQQSSSMLKVLYVIGGIVFFVVYTIVWVKIFSLPLPF